MPIQRYLFCFLTGSLIAAAPSVARDEVVDLAPLQVESNNLPAASDVFQTGVHILDFENFQRKIQSSLGEALSWESGISSSFYGAGSSRPVVRGMEGYRVSVSDGGLSTGDLSASSPDHAVAIEPLFVRAVTIHRGAATLLHGGGAVGGAVDTEPDYIPIKSQIAGQDTELGTIYETAADGRTAYAKAGYGSGSLAFRLNLLTRDTNDYSVPGYARTEEYDINNRIRLPPSAQGKVAPNPNGKVPNTWTRTNVAAAGGGWFSGNHSITTGYQHYESRYGVPLDGHTHGNPYGTTGPNAGDGVTIDLSQDRIIAEAHTLTDLTLLEYITVSGAAVRYRQKEFEGDFLSNDFSMDSQQLQLKGVSTGTFWQLFTGVDFDSNQFENTNVSYSAGRPDTDHLETTSQLWAVHSLGEITLQKTALRGGFRYETQTAIREDLTGYSGSHSTTSVTIELEQALSHNWTVTLSLSKANRLPNANELYIEAPHGAIGIYHIPNPALDTERSNGAELRISRKGERFHFNANMFIREFHGYIFLENQGYEVGGLTAYTPVQRDARFTGGELEAGWIIYRTGTSRLSLSFFSDYVHADDLTNNEPLPRIPPLRIGSRLDFRWKQWQSGLHTLHAFKQNRVPREVFGTLSYQSISDAYTLVTAYVERSFKTGNHHWQISLRLSNLFNQEARQHTSFLKDIAPLPAHSLSIRLSLQF